MDVPPLESFWVFILISWQLPRNDLDLWRNDISFICRRLACLSTGTTVLTRKNIDSDDEKMTQYQKKRDIHYMPHWYNRHKTISPWTTPWENVGWSLAGFFTGEGTTTTLNKISDLAWQVLSLENDTAHALGLISEELKKMREAVIQNKLVLDILTLERGGGRGL